MTKIIHAEIPPSPIFQSLPLLAVFRDSTSPDTYMKVSKELIVNLDHPAGVEEVYSYRLVQPLEATITISTPK